MLLKDVRWKKFKIVEILGNSNNSKAYHSENLKFSIQNEKGIPYDKILFFQENKAESCLAESVDVFIDDKERVLDEIAKLGIKTLIFSEKKETSKHQVVSSWKEVKNYILKHYL